MPIYDYVCVKCDKHEERLVSISEAEKQLCDCEDGAKMDRTENVANTSFALKGVWFKTHRRY